MKDTLQPAGKTTIAIDVLVTIASLTTLNVPGVSRFSNAPAPRVKDLFKRGQVFEGVIIDVEEDTVYVDLYIVLEHDVSILDVSRKIQLEVARAISEMVGMQVGRINVHVEDIDFPVDQEA
jgi:uncharacterized alkaline shock family protein YloU